MAIENDEREALVKRAERVQALLLADFEEILTPDQKGKRALTSMDRATIARYLKENNFKVDANTLPASLRQLTEDIHARRKNGTPRIMPDPNVVEG